jgi:hypothetical protein
MGVLNVQWCKTLLDKDKCIPHVDFLENVLQNNEFFLVITVDVPSKPLIDIIPKMLPYNQ